MSSSIRNKAKALARDQRVLAALAEHFTGSATVTLDGVPHKIKELQSLLRDRSEAVAAADAVRAKWQTALAEAEARNDEANRLLIALRLHVLSQYGAQSQVAADFGFTTKRRTPSSETKAAAVAKRAATRAAKRAAQAPSQPKPSP